MRTDSWWQIINICNNLPFVTQCQIMASVLTSLPLMAVGVYLSTCTRRLWSLEFQLWEVGGIAPSHSCPGWAWVSSPSPVFWSQRGDNTRFQAHPGWQSPWSKAASGCSSQPLLENSLPSCYLLIPNKLIFNFYLVVLVVLSESINPATQPATLWEMEAWGFILFLGGVLHSTKICKWETNKNTLTQRPQSFLYKNSLIITLEE